jgi:cytochrome c oxidase subunit 3
MLSVFHGNKSRGLFFMWLFVAQDAAMFFGLIAAAIYIRVESSVPFPHALSVAIAAINTLVLTLSGLTLWPARTAASRGDSKRASRWLALAAAGGAIFLGIQMTEYYALITDSAMRMPQSLFDATFFVLTGFHGLHVLAGVVYLSWVAFSLHTPEDLQRIAPAAIYWQFVDAIWILLFILIYLT